jgi:hypothetical protein
MQQQSNEDIPAEIESLANELIRSPNPVDVLMQRRAAGTLPAPNIQDTLLHRVVSVLRNGDVSQAVAVAMIAIALDSGRFFREARRQGMFRCSKHAFETAPLRAWLQKLREDSRQLEISPDDQNYLDSVENLLVFADEARSVRAAIVEFLRQRPSTAIKSALICVDRAFRPLGNDVDEAVAAHIRRRFDPDFFTPERKAQGFSTLVSIFQEEVGFQHAKLGFVDEELIADGSYEDLLLAAAGLGDFIEAETMLDAYPYRVESTGKGVTISAIEERFEKAVKLGYIQADLQADARLHRAAVAHNESSSSIENLSEHFYQKFARDFIKLKKEPVERYAMVLPNWPPLVDALREDRVFMEEAFYLEASAIENFVSVEWLITAEIVPGVRVIDLIKVQRYFSFTSRVFFRALDDHPHKLHRDRIDMYSRLPVYSAKVLTETLTFLLGGNVAEKILPLLTYDLTDGGHYDAQYRPLLRIGDSYLVAMAVLASSNLVRNSLYVASTRLFPKGKPDPMQTMVCQALEAKGFKVAPEFARTVDGRKLEIDLLAYKDGQLFTMECKNAFHPCGPHEMRTSYAHIVKAGKQLKRAKEWLLRPGVQATIFRDLKWDAQPTEGVSTCVVTANRLFTGYSIDGHPVRQAHELKNMVQSGVIRLDGTSYRLWSGETLQANDLLTYLSDSGIVGINLDAMYRADVSRQIGSGSLTFSTYVLDLASVKRSVSARYPEASSKVVNVVLTNTAVPENRDRRSASADDPTLSGAPT